MRGGWRPIPYATGPPSSRFSMAILPRAHAAFTSWLTFTGYFSSTALSCVGVLDGQTYHPMDKPRAATSSAFFVIMGSN
eukprot:scaffold661092_cov65-Prasinocladus_malaysianus.AAC.1